MISAFSRTLPSGMYIIKVIFKVISFFQWAWRIFILAATIKSSDLNLLLLLHSLLASGRHTSRIFQRSPACTRPQPWVSSVSFLFFFSSPLLCENRWNVVKTVGNDGNTFESYEETGQELDLLQTNHDTTGTFDICDAILVGFRHLPWRTWPSVMQTHWGSDLPLKGRFNLVVLCHPHHNGKHKQTPIFIYPPLVSNLGGLVEWQEYTLGWSPVHHKTHTYTHCSPQDSILDVSWGRCSGPVVGIVKTCAFLLLLYCYLIFRISCEVSGIKRVNKKMNIMFFQFIIAMCDLTNQVDCCPDYDTQTSSAINK